MLAEALRKNDSAETRVADLSRDLAAAHQANATLRVRINRLEDLILQSGRDSVKLIQTADIIPY